MSIDELEAVEDFTLGRIDVGEVTWIGPTNVRGLDLDKIVQLEPREVIVYPDEEEKPEVGQSLNKPAEVSTDDTLALCKGYFSNVIWREQDFVLFVSEGN